MKCQHDLEPVWCDVCTGPRVQSRTCSSDTPGARYNRTYAAKAPGDAAPRSYQPWSRSELQQALAGHPDGNVALALQLGRSVGAVNVKRSVCR